ncbi:MAG: HipA domain-containing protein [bacterium]|nr:HipA domain-containing protein [bacterium]MDY4098494.1 HipA domain-containing protein [Lachnospiraceae bacterium]
MIDFTNLPVRNKTYAGANGSKISVIYNNELYMLKFPAIPAINKEMSYANGCISEYIGCHIFESIGIPVQKTLLGTYTKNGKQKIVVACKDFTVGGLVLQDFASLKNTIIDSVHNGYGTELSDIEKTLEEQTAIESQNLTEWFWDMFIVDALIGNWDRHNGNWGFLYNAETDEISLAPIYDCGSCLFPQADEEIMKKTLDDPAEREIRVFERPLSGIKINGQKIQYFKFISSLENGNCNKALRRILPKIDMDQIYKIIDETPFISNLQKSFYKVMLQERKERILDFSYRKLCK